MRRRLSALVLSVVFLLSPTLAVSAEGAVGTSPRPAFPDVPADAWYAAAIDTCVDAGLMKGIGDGTFQPGGILTAAEAETIAARLHSLLSGGSGVLPKAPAGTGTISFFLPDGSPLPADLPYGVGPEKAAGPLSFALYLDRVDWQRIGAPETLTALVDGNLRLTGTVADIEYNVYNITILFPVTEEEFARFDPMARLLVEETTGGWYWDADCYLKALPGAAQAFQERLDPSAPVYREYLFSLLALVCPSDNLTPINQISALPDSSDPDVLRFYNAGILAGKDANGTFDPWGQLTRAECAAMAARILNPELRLHFTLAPLPYQDYTLTPLLPNCQVSWMDPITADRALVTCYDLAGTHPKDVVLWMDGSVHSLEEGLHIASWYPPNPSLAEVVKEGPTGPSGGVLNLRDHTLSVPLGQYETCQSTPDGHILLRSEAGAELQLLDGGGTFLAVLPEGAEWSCYSEGVAPRLDEATGLYGYVDRSGQWVLPARWSAAGPFQEGFAVVQTGSGAGLIDKNGTTVLPCRYSRLDCLGDGLYYWKDAAGHAAGLAGTDGTSAFNDYVGDMPICSGGYISSYDRILNRASTPVTPTFDFAGPVDENGSALMVVDKQMYRLTFADA